MSFAARHEAPKVDLTPPHTVPLADNGGTRIPGVSPTNEAELNKKILTGYVGRILAVQQRNTAQAERGSRSRA